MLSPNHFAVVAIPLNRPPVTDFLYPPQRDSRGACVRIIGQRPSPEAEAVFVKRLRQVHRPAATDLLYLDQPHTHLRRTRTDRLVPVEFLWEDDDFLTRNLGGWTPIYFGVMAPESEEDVDTDPVLQAAHILTDYGPQIKYFGADPQQVADRLPQEMGVDVLETKLALLHLYDQRPQKMDTISRIDHVERVYGELVRQTYFRHTGRPLPVPLLYDELFTQMVRIELTRRRAQANGDDATVMQIGAWQSEKKRTTGLTLILKGEYIMGRHRRSTILIAPQLSVVVKQPAPEPFHEADMAAKTYNGREENWPRLMRGGAIVTPRGRIRQLIDEGLVIRLHDVCRHPMQAYSLLGLTVERFIDGPTVQEKIWRERDFLRPELYDVFLRHQQVCELLEVENGDWHAANFVLDETHNRIVHVDWGAARLMTDEEKTAEGRIARMNQVRNIAYSFHDEELAAKSMALHDAFMADEQRQARVRREAQAMIDAADGA